MVSNGLLRKEIFIITHWLICLTFCLTLSPPKGPYGPTVFMENCKFSGGKAFGILIDLKGYAHCIYLLLTESLLMIPPRKRQSTLGFPVKLNFSRA